MLHPYGLDEKPDPFVNSTTWKQKRATFCAYLREDGTYDWPTASWRDGLPGSNFWEAAKTCDYVLWFYVYYGHVMTLKWASAWVGMKFTDFNTKPKSNRSKSLPACSHKAMDTDEALPYMLQSANSSFLWAYNSPQQKEQFYSFLKWGLDSPEVALQGFGDLTSKATKRHKRLKQVLVGWMWGLCCGLKEKDTTQQEWWKWIAANVDPTLFYNRAATITKTGENYIMQGANRRATDRLLSLLRTAEQKELWIKCRLSL